MKPFFQRSSYAVGLHKNREHIEIAFFNDEQQPCFERLSSEQLSQLPLLLKSQFTATLRRQTRFIYISSLEPRLLWQKHLLLPHIKQPHELYRQVRLILQQHLPIEEQLLQFDFSVSPLQHIGTERQIDYVQIYAAKKQNIQQQCEQFLPLHLDILDFHAHALLRAFHYCAKIQGEIIRNENTLFIYQDDQHSIFLQQRQDNLVQFYRPSQPLTALLQAFWQQQPPSEISNQENICHVVYADPNSLAALQQDYQPTRLIAIDPQQYPYFVALGCALRQQHNLKHFSKVNRYDASRN
ncbi:hypothetical protein [Testudinibacter aquarius]|uniref:Competence protein A n=1 Tax=Testudinibacter aquarius TaxID=1524974 RepID=A0A4R3Y0T5_9PAST|nr:hypothetical protein [Testudinibacter aquarius]KAE9525367.1 hypothetical protein A1D24_04815 [Testudinibacter aquarius]TCV85276.1 hypothetical protein EDC16_10954 [Testudinibacter aquarius]TNG92114.1 hypothetical protein FHQ21_05570 [Testudinibacter aquarius]